MQPDLLVDAKLWSAAPKRGNRNRSDSFQEKKQGRRKRDFMLFCGMNFALIQSPYILTQFYRVAFKGCVDCLFGATPQQLRDVPALFALVSTLGVPILSHGVGGILFHPKQWSFHHPFDGGSLHVKTQAIGWTLLAVAGLMQVSRRAKRAASEASTLGIW